MTDTDKIMDVADVLAAYLTDELPEVSRLVFNGEIAEMAARAIAAIEARVRAEVAGTTRKKIRVEMRWTFHREPWVGHGTDAATCTQCEVATDAAVLAIAAGSSPDTTPEPKLLEMPKDLTPEQFEAFAEAWRRATGIFPGVRLDPSLIFKGDTTPEPKS